ncbi:serine/threonine protein kinase [Scheffersomyces amazonensis]|uniref:serine/threonine protein kinase n=1 Tax=Scheffersomyces amazonensis TaxID=1078765 RepID=UPI00315D8914
MNGSSRVINDQNQTAQLAAQFNEFYLQITSPNISQIGNYRIIEEIGEGAFGKVYLAKHILLNTNVVLKCGLVEDPNIVREIYYHKQLKHKNIVTLYEVIKTENHLWLVLEYCEGSELYYLIYEKKRITIDECRSLFFQIVLALKYVHSLNLTHRDLKLENILFSDKKKTIIKLTDFGFVREFNPSSRKFLSTVCGTTVYMAPELLKNEKYSGFAIDIWSLGVILYTMVYGQMPFDEDDELRTKFKIIHEEPIYHDIIPIHLIQLISKMLNKDPQQRPDLNEILNSEFLIDLNNKYLAKVSKTKVRLETESVISIHQHYNSCKEPFQSKTERDIIKRLQKLNFDIDDLQRGVYMNDMNPLTSFYELLLTQEFSKKKQRYYRERKKRYYDAKRTLKKSGKRVRSALSLVDQATGGSSSGQPLERIMSTLSLSSNRNSSKTNIHKLTNEKRKSTDVERRVESQSTRNSDSLNLNLNVNSNANLNANLMNPSVTSPASSKTKIATINSNTKKDFYIPDSPTDSRTTGMGTSLTRVVSFVPDDSVRKPSVTSYMTTEKLNSHKSNSSYISTSTKKKSKNNNFLEKIQFWKKNKNGEDNSSYSGNSLPKSSTDYSNNGNNLEKVTPSTSRSLEKPIEKVQKAGLKPAFMFGEEPRKEEITPRDSYEGRYNTPSIEHSSTPPVIDSLPRSTRTRPTSIISQISQMSHISQMSTMMSESELDILDETDTMDEEYDDDDDPDYESSISQDFNRSVGLTPSGSVATSNSVNVKPIQKKKRPGYKRALSSDLSIQSTSTTTTLPAKHSKKFSLSQLSSNSSEESSVKSNSFISPTPNKPTTENPVQTLESSINPTIMARSNSPDLSKNKKRWRNPIFSNNIGGGSSSTNESSLLKGPSTTTVLLRSQSPPVMKRPPRFTFDHNKSNSNSPVPQEVSNLHSMDAKWESPLEIINNSPHTLTSNKTPLYGVNEEDEGDY